MSTLNKFIIYQCDVCSRQTEIQIDSKRPDPIQCNITNKCRGKLRRIGESSSKKFLFTPPVSGLQDYIQRGTVIPDTIVQADDPNIKLTIGGSGLTVALLSRTEYGASHSYTVIGSTVADPIVTSRLVDIQPNSEFSRPQNVKAYLNVYPISSNLLISKTYTYLVTGSVQVLRGPDNSPNSSNLRFTSANLVTVFVNGVVSTGYTLDEANQQIVFSPIIFDTNNVITVIVYNDLSSSIDVSTLIQLEFSILEPNVTDDLAFLNASAWGDYEAVNIPNVGTRYLMRCNDLSALMNDTSYGVKDITFTNNFSDDITVLSTEFKMLIANPPYSFFDKELNAYLTGADSLTVFTYSQDPATGVYNLTAPQSKFTQLLRSMTPTVQIDPTDLINSTVGAATVASTITHRYVLGPT